MIHLEKGFINNTEGVKYKLTQGPVKAESVWDSVVANQSWHCLQVTIYYSLKVCRPSSDYIDCF